MKIKIEQISKAFDNCLDHIYNEWKKTHRNALPSVLEVTEVLKDQMNIKYIDMRRGWVDDILEFNSEEDYFLFLMAWS